MHEAGIMQEALDRILETARGAGARQVDRIQLRIGELSGVVPEALLFAFDSLKHGTVAGEAKLEIETVSAAYHCHGCGAEFIARDLVEPCPRCACANPSLIRGLEIELVAVEVC